jgi:hypothetical protein
MNRFWVGFLVAHLLAPRKPARSSGDAGPPVSPVGCLIGLVLLVLLIAIPFAVVAASEAYFRFSHAPNAANPDRPAAHSASTSRRNSSGRARSHSRVVPGRAAEPVSARAEVNDAN